MKGVYVLNISVSRNIKPEIGALGKISFEKGLYTYVGSAQNNLEKRVARHLSRDKKLRWHIDYLLDSGASRITKVFYKEAGKTEECRLARALGQTEIPVPRFGCSDCRCSSHLFKLDNINNIEKLEMKEL